MKNTKRTIENNISVDNILYLLTKELKIVLKQIGKYYFFLCPFHDSKNPNCSFEPNSKVFICFFCGFKARNIFDFWAKFKKVDLVSSKKEIAKILDAKQEEKDSDAPKEKNLKNETISTKTTPLVAPVEERNVKQEEKSKKSLDKATVENKSVPFHCSLGICESETNYKRYHKGINGEDIEKQERKIHCKECKKSIPFHLLRGTFYQIVESKAFFKLLITGKGTGKSVNLMLFQVWWIMNHKLGSVSFVWVYRNQDDLLDKGRSLWDDVMKKHLPKKHAEGVLPEFDPKEWKDSRGSMATARGLVYNGIRVITFISLQDWDRSNSSQSGDATHYVFDEAMAANGKYIDNEEGIWGHIFDNVMREGDMPTICWFLANPHTKGAWWLGRYTKQEWVEKAFAKDGQRHIFDGDVFIKLVNRNVPCLLYQAPAERGEYGWMINTTCDTAGTRRPEGTFSDEVNKYIKLPMPKNIKQLRLLKDCIWAREIRSGITEHKQFIYKRRENEKLDPSVVHLCFSIDEFSNSECKKEKRILIDRVGEMKYWLKDMLFWGLEMNKKNPLFFTGEDESQASQAKDVIMGLIKTNLKNLDKSGKG